MIGFLILLVHVLVSPFKTQARLDAEIVLLRHQSSALRQRRPSGPKLTVADRLLFVWLYRLFPSVLNAVTIVQPEPSSVNVHCPPARHFAAWCNERNISPDQVARLIFVNEAARGLLESRHH